MLDYIKNYERILSFITTMGGLVVSIYVYYYLNQFEYISFT